MFRPSSLCWTSRWRLKLKWTAAIICLEKKISKLIIFFQIECTLYWLHAFTMYWHSFIVLLILIGYSPRWKHANSLPPGKLLFLALWLGVWLYLQYVLQTLMIINSKCTQSTQGTLLRNAVIDKLPAVHPLIRVCCHFGVILVYNRMKTLCTACLGHWWGVFDPCHQWGFL